MTSGPLTTIGNFTVVAQFCFSVDVIACIRLIVASETFMSIEKKRCRPNFIEFFHGRQTVFGFNC